MSNDKKILENNINIAIELGNVLKEISGYDFNLDVRKDFIIVEIKRKDQEEVKKVKFNIL